MRHRTFKVPWFILTCLLFTLVLLLVFTNQASALAPNVVAGTAVVDGDPSEWNTSTSGPDFFIYGCVGQGGTTTGCLRPQDGSPTTAWYMRYDCHTQTLYVYVKALGSNTIDSDNDQYVKGYPDKNDKIIDKSGTGLTLAFVYVPPSGTPKTGWEASGGPIPPGTYSVRLEAHTNPGANSSKSNDVPMTLTSCPTAARIESFRGTGNARNVRLKWRTATELDVVSFNVWRTTARNGTFTQLNSAPVLVANPGSLTGTKYIYLDKTAKAGKVYLYKLELVGVGGTLEWSDVVRVRKPK